MSVHTITADNFQPLVRDNAIVMLDFWAAWCGPCKGFAPIYDAAAARHGDVVFGKIDTDAETELAQSFEIRSVPTLMIIRDGIMVVRESGAVPAGTLEEMIQFVRDLDMDQIRAEIASESAGGAQS